MTDDRIGRSMKKWVNMARRPTSSLGRASAAALPAASPAFAAAGAPARRSSPAARHDLQHAVDDHAVTRVQAGDDDDVLLAVVVADDHRPHLGDAGLR